MEQDVAYLELRGAQVVGTAKAKLSCLFPRRKTKEGMVRLLSFALSNFLDFLVALARGFFD